MTEQITDQPMTYVTQEMWDKAQRALAAALPVLEQHTPRLSTNGTMVSLVAQVRDAMCQVATKPPEHAMTNEKKMEAPYVCPQCGHDPRGSEEHARLFHTFMHVDAPRYGSPAPTAPEAVAAFYADIERRISLAPTAPGDQSTADEIADLRSRGWIEATAVDALREQLAGVRNALRICYEQANEAMYAEYAGPHIGLIQDTCKAVLGALPASADESPPSENSTGGGK